MKKFTKICLLMAAVLAILGVAACAAGAVMGAGYHTLRDLWRDGDLQMLGWNIGEDGIGWHHGEDSEWDDAEESVERFKAAEVSEIAIYLKHGTLEIEKSDTDEIVVEVEKNNGDFRSALKDGVLTLEDNRSKGIARKDCEVKLELPENIDCKQIKIENHAGLLESDELVLMADKVEIKVDAGELDMTGVRAEKFRLEVGAGNADISDLDAEEIDISCGVGNIDLQLRGKEKDYNYRIKCGVGDIDINGTSYTALGKEKEISNRADRDVRLECGVGNISVEVD